MKELTLEQCGYHLLFLLSIVDGNFDDRETEPIVNYLRRNAEGGFDIEQENAFLNSIPEEDFADHFNHVARRYLELSNEDQRNEFLLFALSLVLADGSIAEEENISFSTLAEYWGIDLQHFMKEVMPILNSNLGQTGTIGSLN